MTTSLYWCKDHGEWTEEATINRINKAGETVRRCPVCLLPLAEISIYNERCIQTYVCTKPGCKWFGWDPLPNVITTNDKPSGWTMTCPYCGSLVEHDKEGD